MENDRSPSKESPETSDFAHLRAPGDPPKIHDRPSICNTIRGFDQDILRLDPTMATFENELEKVKATRSGHASLISPLRSLPLEIFGEIFLYAASKSPSFRLNASHVCQHWRMAALSTSELWSTIDGVSSASSQALQEYVQACVHRARSRPLKLSYNCPFYRQCEVLRILMQVTQGYPWQVFAWKNMDIALLQAVQNFLASSSHDTLETLSLDIPGNSSEDSSPCILDVGLFSERLTSLTFSSYQIINPATLNAHWPRLTHLDISCKESDNQTILSILRQCSNIEEFKIASEYIGRATPGPMYTPIHLPKLRKLHLSSNPTFFILVAYLVVTPLLQELVINDDGSSVELGKESQLCRYLLAGAKTLRRLWITGISHRDIEEIILKLELLEELTLVCNSDTPLASTLCWLRVEAQNSWTPKAPSETGVVASKPHIPLPYLYALNIVCALEFDTQDTFEDIVESRWWPDDTSTQTRPVVRLRHVSLRTYGRRDRLIMTDKVKYWKQQGLNVNLLNGRQDNITPGFISFSSP